MFYPFPIWEWVPNLSGRDGFELNQGSNPTDIRTDRVLTRRYEVSTNPFRNQKRGKHPIRPTRPYLHIVFKNGYAGKLRIRHPDGPGNLFFYEIKASAAEG